MMYIKKEIKILIAVFLLFISLPALSATNSTHDNSNIPITIDANHQEFNIENNTVIFSGNVVIEQGSLRVTANKVVISNVQDNNKQKIIAYGSPVYLKQTFADGKTVQGESAQVHYNVAQHQITLIGKAKLKQQDNIISSEQIIYKINERQVIAEGSKQSRVRTTIIPKQIKETNK